MPLILGFAVIIGGVLLLTSGITSASFADVLKGNARTIYDQNRGVGTASSPTAAAGTVGATGSSAPTGAIDSTGSHSPTGWAKDLLTSLGAPLTQANISSIVQWERMEGGNWNNTARFNPLNTTERMPGSTVMGGGSSAGVQAYTSWEQGLAATVKTLRSSSYNDIVSALKSGNGLHGTIHGLYVWSGSYSSIS